MTLEEFVKTHGQKKAADVFGVSQGMVSHWLCGRKKVAIERALMIEQATQGAVTRQELRPDFFLQMLDS